jgi:hypothetical protein
MPYTYFIQLQAEYHPKTQLINDPKKIIEEIANFNMNSNKLSISCTIGGMQLCYNYFFEIKKQILDKYKRGEHKGIRYMSFIDKDNMEAVKNFLDAGARIKHVKNLPPMSLGVSDKEVITTMEEMNEGKVSQSLLVSKDEAIIKYFGDIFEDLWKNGLNAVDRIKDIEEGRQTDDDLADAKRYLDKVLNEVTKMKSGALVQQNISS